MLFFKNNINKTTSYIQSLEMMEIIGQRIR